ncbi:MAG: hypothetical protein F4Z58_07095 [Acidimicrobiaceae bacterium]|nr:hypothetical protein [Acidimicrobiaceae bacterium]MXW75793.1 hypothetical protein [Acidimicrobiaceae bacterium]MYC43110.1 hypothetical protein [Acidimicrobiaceae bacterium]MYD08123.1 hypothetical protein [Acidimicrobiaceae bacterium]MYH88208.1 hypothetical protein [Acidimicrobiaceae bacterium]
MAPRIKLPKLFDEEPWDSVIIATYGADLAFYERDLWRQIDYAKNRLILADGRQIQRSILAIENTSPLRHVNRSYILAPIRLSGAAHAKLLLLLAEDRGLLAVGSGNLRMDGYASQGECFTTYRWSEEDPRHLNAFVTAKDFLEQVITRGHVDEFVKPRIQQAWQDAPWIFGVLDGATSTVRHNLDIPLLDQLIEVIDGRLVRELVVHAPFYDHSYSALSEIIDRTQPQYLRILLQERITSVDPRRLTDVLSTAPGQVEVRTVEAHERGTFLHTKFIVARLNSSEVCLQGSANVSTPALLQDGRTGNIEIANLLEATPGTFEHLVSDLVISDDPVDISSLSLSLIEDDDEPDIDEYAPHVRELTWVRPQLTGFFEGEIDIPPEVKISESTVDDVEWQLDTPRDGMTQFRAILSESAFAQLDRVAAVTFAFGSGRRTAPAYPYHLNALEALSSGQGQTDLLKQAGDFDLDDEEIERLLVQLDEVLIVDGRSLWRMLKRDVPESASDEESVELRYEDLDWDAIRSHPKLAQYRTWDQRGHADPTGLEILLGSIADRFRSEARQRRCGGVIREAETETTGDPLDDLAKTIDAEDEETAEAEEAEVEGRRMSARNRARRQFQSFVKRFVTGLSDIEFTRLVGPSVIVPSYVVFNHLCWKLAQLDLIDQSFVVDAQVKLWGFFWGDTTGPGYLATMSEDEQLASIDLLDAHCAEATMLASVHQAYGIAWRLEDADVVRVRDLWCVILTHDLGGVGRTSVQDAAANSGSGLDALPLADFVADLADLADYTPDHEIFVTAAGILGCRADDLTKSEVKVHRGDLGNEIVEELKVADPLVELDQPTAVRLFSELARLLPEGRYLRVSHSQKDTGAFADYERGVGFWYDRHDDAESEFDPPGASRKPWDASVAQLRSLAA